MFKRLKLVFRAEDYSGSGYDYKEAVAHLMQPNRILVASYDSVWGCWEVYEVV